MNNSTIPGSSTLRALPRHEAMTESKSTFRRISVTSKHLASKSWRSLPRNQYRLSILLLPPEIRNKILELVLIPGDIYLPAKPPDIIIKARRVLRAQDNIEAVIKRLHYPCLFDVLKAYQAWQDPASKHGCQILATCKQLYCEGHRMWYEMNTFHLAPGPLSASRFHFDKLQPHHRRLIRHLAFDSRIEHDLTRDTVAELKRGVEMGVLGRFNRHHRPFIPYRLAHVICDYVKHIWSTKLIYLRSWTGLADLKLCHHRALPKLGPSSAKAETVVLRQLFIRGEDAAAALAGVVERSHDEQINDFVCTVLGDICGDIMLKMAIHGEGAFWNWLESPLWEEVVGVENHFWCKKAQ